MNSLYGLIVCEYLDVGILVGGDGLLEDFVVFILLY